ncbi:hypothetical protein KUTeg_002572 [Tegillarca granosa]|uniref:Protein kinase domain-containing protein n=1 Tax=Tegillarca granosa TaxID=220873 RepID=A0ABQ9FZ31_TEGGR|nr:hypothetical protein KUTeg_002572 [Tegillarca granosa]
MEIRPTSLIGVFLLICMSTGQSYSLSDENGNHILYKLENISSCAVKIKHIGTINLKPLERTDGFPRSMVTKTTNITLKCNRTLYKVEDARFDIIEDDTRLGIRAELSHICCCPNACINGIPPVNNTNLGISLASGNMTDIPAISVKILTLIGVNVGVVVLAGIVASMCYVKRTNLQIYYKLPVIQTFSSRRTEDPSMDDLMENGLSGATPGPIPRPVAYRDYEPDSARQKKPVQLPVLDDCLITKNSITLGQRLGGGLFGDTHVGVFSGLKVAVTRITVNIHEDQITPESLKVLTDEVWFLSRQRHRNIVSMFGLCVENRLPYIISEFVEGETVKYYIQNRDDCVTWPQRMKICLQVADGMAYLHSTNPPILHRDLRCSNLFISSHDIIKVGDFGLVRLIQPFRDKCDIEDCSQGQYSACPSSPRWTAPEVLENPTSKENESNITASSDVYSFGVAELVKQGVRPEIPNSVAIMPQYRTLMKQCWNGDPESRPSFKQIATRSKELIHQSKTFQKALFNKQRLEKIQQTYEVKD